MCDCQLQPVPIIAVKKVIVFPLSFNCQALLFTPFSTSENVNAGPPYTESDDLLKEAGLITLPE